MSLVQRCRKEISAADWRKGGDYFHDAAVSRVRVGETSLTASVAGSRQYKVVIDWSDALSDRTLQVDCSCPRFADMGICKHVAAVLFAVDSQNLDKRVPGDFPLTVVDLAGHATDDFDEEEDGFYDDDFDEEEDDFDPDYDFPEASARPQGLPRVRGKQPGQSKSELNRQLHKLSNAFLEFAWRRSTASQKAPAKPRQLYFVLDLAGFDVGQLILEFWHCPLLKNGAPGVPKVCTLDLAVVAAVEDPAERELLTLMLHCGSPVYGNSSYSYGYGGYSRASRLALPAAMGDLLLPRLCATGKFGRRSSDVRSPQIVRPLAWDAGPPWEFRIHSESDFKQAWKLAGELYRPGETLSLDQLELITATGLVVLSDRLARWNVRDHWPWVLHLRREGPMVVKNSEIDAAVEKFYALPGLPPWELPAAWAWRQISPVPRPSIRLHRAKNASPGTDFTATVSFQYGDRDVPSDDEQAAVVDRAAKQIVVRDRAAEQGHLDSLKARGFRKSPYSYKANDFILPPAKFMPAVEQLIADDWRVEAEGQPVRTAGAFNISVTSGVDWFDVAAVCDFGGVSASLPELLEAVRHGQNFVVLGDGSRGMLPQEWLDRYSPLADLGKAEGAALRFTAPQAAILDALLSAQPQVQYDVAFTRIRRKLQQFDGIAPRQEPATFQGELREYQREGLGWLHFLQEFGYGGCLADDMGLGKTVQVLALLESRRKRNGKHENPRRPSLVVVPKSLVFNWLDEARRFTPKLRALDYTGLQRGESLSRLDECDLLVTTYGTLRRDVMKLREIPFDYVILDEAQAIKNANSQSAKSCRLLQARHRLAMTGTPVENHLGELWSLFEFLNPGMLGRSGKLTALAGKSRTGDAASLELLRKALRPYMLRRTKSQVLRELPEKTEQTLHCELEGDERKRYDELRNHYRDSLLKRIDQVGLKKAKMHVLEALLRLRQAACHGGLIDKKRRGESSAKLDLLLEQLQEVRAEGHKALVFSQFTSFLDIVRKALDRDKITYEYLDGRTRDRQARVERFQTDANCPLFLISLKAGGHGLNLTAADYVFILDPWWNPAVEMQAIDRAHRIGQTKPVFAYRLIARGTVEEKILKLQEQKRELAEAIIAADDRLVANLTADDLRLLLS